jgi:hypothetical protein
VSIITDKQDHDMIVEMHAVLLGSNGQDGLCRRVGSLERRVTNLIMVLSFLAGAGLLGTGIFELIRWATV